MHLFTHSHPHSSVLMSPRPKQRRVRPSRFQLDDLTECLRLSQGESNSSNSVTNGRTPSHNEGHYPANPTQRHSRDSALRLALLHQHAQHFLQLPAAPEAVPRGTLHAVAALQPANLSSARLAYSSPPVSPGTPGSWHEVIVLHFPLRLHFCLHIDVHLGIDITHHTDVIRAILVPDSALCPAAAVRQQRAHDPVPPQAGPHREV